MNLKTYLMFLAIICLISITNSQPYNHREFINNEPDTFSTDGWTFNFIPDNSDPFSQSNGLKLFGGKDKCHSSNPMCTISKSYSGFSKKIVSFSLNIFAYNGP